MVIVFALAAVTFIIVGFVFMSEALEIFAIPLIISGLMFAFLAGKEVYDWDLSQREVRCAQYGTETGRETKFKKLSWGSWDCFTEVDGYWVPTSKVIKTINSND